MVLGKDFSVLGVSVVRDATGIRIYASQILTHVHGHGTSLPPVPHTQDLTIASRTGPDGRLGTIILTGALINCNSGVSLSGVTVVRGVVGFSGLRTAFRIPNSSPGT